MTVFKEYFEVTGVVELARARAFAVARTAAFDAQWALVQSLGGVGFRPGHGGSIRTVMFPRKPDHTVPTGWKRRDHDGKKDECNPSRSTKVGREFAKKLASVEPVEDWGKFANTFGWKGRSPIDGFKVYFCGGVHVRKPVERFFLVFPRELNDGWKAPEGLTEVRESDMLRAIEDHNALVKD